jgi:hypothetical protein
MSHPIPYSRRVLLGLALVLLVAPVSAESAPGKPLTPPYADVVTFTQCLPTGDVPTTSECFASATADKTSGAVGMDLTVTSPLNGLLPGSGFASGDSGVVVTYALQRAAGRIDFTITIHVNSATAARTGQIHQPPAGDDPETNSRTFARVTHDSCDSCFGGAPDTTIVCIDSSSPSPIDAPCTGSVSNEDFIVEAALVNPDGPVPPGLITIQTGVDGVASLGFVLPIDTGRSVIAVDAVVTKIIVRPT